MQLNEIMIYLHICSKIKWLGQALLELELADRRNKKYCIHSNQN